MKSVLFLVPWFFYVVEMFGVKFPAVLYKTGYVVLYVLGVWAGAIIFDMLIESSYDYYYYAGSHFEIIITVLSIHAAMVGLVVLRPLVRRALATGRAGDYNAIMSS